MVWRTRDSTFASSAGLLDYLEESISSDEVLERMRHAGSRRTRHLLCLEGLRFTEPIPPVKISPRCSLRQFSAEEWTALNSPLREEQIRPELIRECVFLEFPEAIEPDLVTFTTGYELPVVDDRPRTAIDETLPELLTLALTGVGPFQPGARLVVRDGWSVSMRGSFNGTFISDGSWVPGQRSDTRIRRAEAEEIRTIAAHTFETYDRALRSRRRLREVARRFIRATQARSTQRPAWEERESCVFELVRVVDGAMSGGKHGVGKRWTKFFEIVQQIQGAAVPAPQVDEFSAARNAIAHGDIVESLPDIDWLEGLVRRFLRVHLHLTAIKADLIPEELSADEREDRIRREVLEALDLPLSASELDVARNAGLTAT